MARADLYTQTQKKQEYFSDFLTSFDKHPISDDVARLTNENSVRQSIKNLVLTNYGERLYNSQIGSNVNKSLFEPYSPFTAEDLIRQISDTIKAKETRAFLHTVNVYPSPDQNYFSVNIIFSIINNPEPITLDFILRRVK